LRRGRKKKETASSEAPRQNEKSSGHGKPREKKRGSFGIRRERGKAYGIIHDCPEKKVKNATPSLICKERGGKMKNRWGEKKAGSAEIFYGRKEKITSGRNLARHRGEKKEVAAP